MKIKMLRVVASAMSGNALEFYDLSIYGLFATTIAQHFFPKQDKLLGIASAFALFFIGYLARPLGGLFFGRMGDNFGRKPALILSIWLMALSTSAISILPDYHAIDVWAPLLLLILRLIQGFSCGGEATGSLIFVIEHAPRTKRGFYGSLAGAGFSSGLLLASLVAWLIQTFFSEPQVASWAWRLPFLLSLFGGAVGWLARRSIPETELFLENVRTPQPYLMRFREYAKQKRPALMIIGMTLFGSVLWYLIYVFSLTYMSTMLHYTQQQGLNVNILSILLLILLVPWAGILSDRIGRRPVMVFGLIGTVIWIWPYFLLMQQYSMTLALLAQLVITLFTAAYVSILVVTMIEIVPVQLRFTVVAFAYAVAISLFGGVTPLIATLLLRWTNSYIGLVLFLWVAALISLFAVYKTRETRYAPKTVQQSIAEIAQQMLAEGDSVEKVTQVTGLSEAKIKAMKP